ncbi:fibronectin type III domain-containing protein [Pedobacter boryungensis]|uniref:Fibronectin type III domain-containing protein n=1 Tax=Pedobacter boryungensis TaxID=869962 RepID=A0ABX2DBL3_9SPHI|nr:fibronectin type III domain-containing protein [Pedobacter boryungensis]NQX31439.1 fibronectin type III domain-containing protein [Pedobacter boryungensis]
MTRPRIITGFSRYRDTELDVKAKFIVDSMTANANFSTPIPALTEITAATNSYIEALSNAEAGGKSQIAIKNQTRLQLEGLLEKLALYVEAYGQSNEVVLLSSGFSLAKTTTPVGILPKPENFTVQPKEKGTVNLKLSSIRGAISYQFEYRILGEETWVVNVQSKSSLALTNLQSGAQYEFRVTAIGSVTDRIYSDEVKSFVL